jgi:hypothetical protein
MKSRTRRLMASACILYFTSASAQFVQKDFIIGANIAPQLKIESSTPCPGDYNGDGKVDIGSRLNSGVNQGKFLIDYAFSTSSWFLKSSASNIINSSIYGTVSDPVVSADYDGDGKTDISVYFKASKTWKVDYFSNGFGAWDLSCNYMPFADVTGNAMPVPADYDGDGQADMSFKTDEGKWIIDFRLNGLNLDVVKTGVGDHTEVPAPADYDGDGKADISVKTDLGVWKIDYAINGFLGWQVTVNNCGLSTSRPVPADYNGDGKADLTVKTDDGGLSIAYSYVSGQNVTWSVIRPSGTYPATEAKTLPADYSGDGKADFGFAFSDARWWIDNFAAQTPGYDFLSDPGKLTNDLNPLAINPTDQSNYLKFKDCGFTTSIDNMAVMFTDRQREYYLKLLDDNNLNTMLTDNKLYTFQDPSPTDIYQYYTNNFIPHYKTGIASNLKSRIYAINLGDEPTDRVTTVGGNTIPNSMINLTAWANMFNTNFPEKPLFSNLLPRYWGAITSDADYITYLQNYKTATPTSPFACFDHYPFQPAPANFIKSYFFNLKAIKDVFKGRALWSTIFSGKSSGGNPSEPNEAQLHFMAFCPIAYGAKGLIYFPYSDFSTFTKTIDSDVNKYNWIKNLNKYIKNIVEPVAIGATNIATLHKSNTDLNSGGYEFSNSELLSNYFGMVKEVNNSSILLGLFAKDITTSDPKTLSVGNYYVWVVNKSTTNTANNVIVTLRGNFQGNVSLAPRVVNYISNPTLTYIANSAAYDPLTHSTPVTIPVLNPGEGIMIKLFSNNNAPAPADYDGDGIMDISVKEDFTTWLIDYSKNGFGKWDFWSTDCGGLSAHPVPADYDGDGKADLSVKTDDQRWLIDYSGDGFWGWNFSATGYGAASALPVPADYDGDGKADLSVKIDDGRWLIDYSVGGFNGWNFAGATFGNQTWHPVPADYDGDGKADLAIKTDAGGWMIDYAVNGFLGWDWSNTVGGPYGNATAHPVPADYDGDGKADLSVKTDIGGWLIDYSVGGFWGWNFSSSIYGNQTAVPFPGDYGGDGKSDLSVKYPNGDWKIDYAKNSFGVWDDIILKPIFNDPISSGIISQGPSVSPFSESKELTKIDEKKQYFVVSIHDIAGRILRKVGKNITLNTIKYESNLPVGIYIVRILINSKPNSIKVFIN